MWEYILLVISLPEHSRQNRRTSTRLKIVHKYLRRSDNLDRVAGMLKERRGVKQVVSCSDHSEAGSKNRKGSNY
jgi:hypothetical protein